MDYLRSLASTLDFGTRFALLLVAGIVVAELVRRILRLPRVTGYALCGVVLGPSWLGFVTPEDIAPLHVVAEMALGLVVFEMGSRVDFSWLRRNPWLLVASAAEAAATFAAVAGFLLFAGVGTSVALMVAAICVASSPAVLLRITHELRARGQATERALLMCALNAIYAIVLLETLVAVMHLGNSGDAMPTLLQPVRLLCGSFLLGAGTALVLDRVFRAFPEQGADAFLLALSVILLCGTVSYRLGLSTPLALLLGGLMLRNRSSRLVLFPPHFGTAGSVLVVLLFVLTGIRLDVALLLSGAGVALGVVVVRSVAKIAVTAALAPVSGLTLRKGALVGVALSPMSALALLLAHHPPLTTLDGATSVLAIVVGVLFVLELAGPVACALALRLAQETPPDTATRTDHARTV
jgi:Kef-type K+ transport system membrane component KefB